MQSFAWCTAEVSLALSLVALLIDHEAERGRPTAMPTGDPMYNATIQGAAALKLVLEEGGDIEERSGTGRTPLGCAALYKEYEQMALLLDAGAEVDAGREVRSRSPLSAAAVADTTVCSSAEWRYRTHVRISLLVHPGHLAPHQRRRGRAREEQGTCSPPCSACALSNPS